MNILKFLLYAGSATVVLGLISEDEELKKSFKEIVKEFEPYFSQTIKKIDALLSDEKIMDLTRVDVTTKEKIKKIHSFVNDSKTKNFDSLSENAIKKIRKELNLLEAKLAKEKVTKKSRTKSKNKAKVNSKK